jgi:integrase/recombinase XerD
VVQEPLRPRTPTLREAVEAFLLSRPLIGCTAATMAGYRELLGRFARTVGEAWTEALTVRRYLADLQAHMKPISAHRHYRALRTFCGWTVEAGLLPTNPLAGYAMRRASTLPRVPEDEAIRRLLGACDAETYEGRRNRALIALLADSGLRIGEALRLRIEDVSFAARTLNVRAGKGRKDGIGFFGAETAQHLRAYLARRRDAHPEDFLFTDRGGRSLTRHTALKVVHRLSARAELPRKVGPHALRHYAATSILRQTGDLELVRQVLRHESLAMALRYAHLTKPDVSAKFRRASPLDNLRAGR